MIITLFTLICLASLIVGYKNYSHIHEGSYQSSHLNIVKKANYVGNANQKQTTIVVACFP